MFFLKYLQFGGNFRLSLFLLFKNILKHLMEFLDSADIILVQAVLECSQVFPELPCHLSLLGEIAVEQFPHFSLPVILRYENGVHHHVKILFPERFILRKGLPKPNV